MRFCAFRVSDMRNMEEIVTCMHNHDAELMPECKEHIDEVFADMAGFHTGCDESLKKWEANVPNPEVYMPVIVEHLAELDAATCLTKISEILMKHMEPHHPEPGPPHMAMDMWAGARELFYQKGAHSPGGRHWGGPLPVFFAGGLFFFFVSAIAKVCVRRFRGRCPCKGMQNCRKMQDATVLLSGSENEIVMGAPVHHASKGSDPSAYHNMA